MEKWTKAKLEVLAEFDRAGFDAAVKLLTDATIPADIAHDMVMDVLRMPRPID